MDQKFGVKKMSKYNWRIEAEIDIHTFVVNEFAFKDMAENYLRALKQWYPCVTFELKEIE